MQLTQVMARWDITSFDENAEKIFIEVKLTTGKTITSVDITDVELI